MSFKKTSGIIIKKYYLRETSYILVIFTKDFGKIKGVIKGVRAPYPQFSGNFEIFTQCEILFYKKKKGMDLITQCNAINPFLKIRKNIESLTYTNYFIELIDIITKDYDQNEHLFNFLLETLNFIEKGINPKHIRIVFELKLLDILGLTPQLSTCNICGRSIEEKANFNIKEGGLLCPNCNLNNLEINLSLGAIKFMRKINTTIFSKSILIKINNEMFKEIENFIEKFLFYNIKESIKSLVFLNTLRNKKIFLILYILILFYG